MKTILLCSDLDRTILPNGKEPESPGARRLLSSFTRQPSLRLAYVSGRDKNLVEEAIAEYDLPLPDFLIGDVGTTLYRFENEEWHLDQGWQEKIGDCWHGLKHGDIVELLSSSFNDISLQLQPESKQNRYKVSYFTSPTLDVTQLKKSLSEILRNNKVEANLIWSLDETDNTGLLDILPDKANKLEAIRFLMKSEGFNEKNTVFAGDSGNDLDVLASGLQAILVKNGADEVRREALDLLREKNKQDRLYVARGGELEMNGNYAAGVIEGLLHFFPECRQWMTHSD